jgi:antitoxin component YwqK of YwqJK toxin-antitoxin module
MNTINLYEKEDYDIYSIYYTDQECTQPYTGHVEEYWNDILSWEADIVDGYGEGIRKEYDENGKLKIIMEEEKNKVNGLEFEYYNSGKILSASLWIDNIVIESYIYDETGSLVEIYHTAAYGCNQT